MHDGVVQDLVEAWAALLARHTADPDAGAVGGRLLASWSEPHRRYHAISHLRDILIHVDELATYADDIDAVRLAAWYHDAVYQGRPDDEERSARRAHDELSGLGVSPDLVDEVARLVRMTTSHDPEPGDRNGETLSDADLASLAIPRDSYAANTAAIRHEYAHVSDEDWVTGRLRVLVALLAAPRVFRTDYGRETWELAARENMRAELRSMGR